MAIIDSLVQKVGLYELVQVALLALALLFAVAGEKQRARTSGPISKMVDVLANRPLTSVLLLVLLEFALRLALAPLLGAPDPIVADEYSLILQAQTYLNHHLANPATLTPNFETTYVLLKPAYASIYPALRSFPLLVGLALHLGAWAGVLLSFAGLVGAVYWMVREWCDARTAMVVALIVIFRWGLFSLWVNSYWGGAFTATGAVLLLAGYRSLIREPRFLSGIAIGAGTAILLTTRPFEGAAASAPVLIALLVHFFRQKPERRASLYVPATITIVIIGSAIGLTAAVNSATTGKATAFAYALYRSQFEISPAWLFQKLPHDVTIATRYSANMRLAIDEAKEYAHTRNLVGLLAIELLRLQNYWKFYVGVALTLPFAIGVFRLRHHSVLIWSAAFLGLALASVSWNWSHYASPGFGLAILAIATGLQAMQSGGLVWARFSSRLGHALPLVVIAGIVAPFWMIISGNAVDPRVDHFSPNSFNVACCWLRPRSTIYEAQRLFARFPGSNLVLVDSGQSAPWTDILVANAPDPAAAETIWVNHDADYDAPTIARFRNRRVWTLTWTNDNKTCLRVVKGGVLPDTALPNGWERAAEPDCRGGVVHATLAPQAASYDLHYLSNSETTIRPR